MDQGTKRKAADGGSGSSDKRSKTKKQWRVPRSNQNGAQAPRAILPGDTGIFATCNKGREAKCVGELRDLFAEYAEQLYGDGGSGDEDEGKGTASIENEIEAELAGIQKLPKGQLFVPVKLDVQCVVFFKTVAPVEPVSFVHKICEDAMANPMHKRTRTAKRLAPMTLMGKATMEGLEEVAKSVLAPHFHQAPVTPKKFCVRPNMRNHNTLKRDAIIKMLAGLVGQPHRVDLKNYDLLITVEIYQNICGVSVVDHRFEELKRYNISEIFDPTPKEEAVKEGKAEVVEVSASAAAETRAEVVPTGAVATEDNKSGTAATDEVSVDDDNNNDKVLESEGGVSLANDDATSSDKVGVSAVSDEVQAPGGGELGPGSAGDRATDE